MSQPNIRPLVRALPALALVVVGIALMVLLFQ
jgi:hypothetical protein